MKDLSPQSLCSAAAGLAEEDSKGPPEPLLCVALRAMAASFLRTRLIEDEALTAAKLPRLLDSARMHRAGAPQDKRLAVAATPKASAVPPSALCSTSWSLATLMEAYQDPSISPLLQGTAATLSEALVFEAIE